MNDVTFSDFIQLFRVFQRADGEGCCKIVEFELLCHFGRFAEPHFIADKTALAALRHIFQGMGLCYYGLWWRKRKLPYVYG